MMAERAHAQDEAPYDAIVIGGSFSGLSAALQLARARRRALVIDSDQRRNRFARRSHGFLTRDGSDAADIVATGREQLLRYPAVQWRNATVTCAGRDGDLFALDCGGEVLRARRLVLATGVNDVLPDLPGLAERWGSVVFHCPYCHGYELQQGTLALLATSPHAFHLAMMLPDWGPTTVLGIGALPFDASQLRQLADRGVSVESRPVQGIENRLDVQLEDGSSLRFDGLFVPTRVEARCAFADALGCEFEESDMGRILKVDAMKATTVPGVFAAGDAQRIGGSVAFAVADGAMAGVAAHRSLLFPPG